MKVIFPNARTQEECLKLHRMTLTLSISERPEHLFALFASPPHINPDPDSVTLK